MKQISKLKKMRVLSGLTQREVALKLGITQSYLSYLERGVFIPSVDLQRKIKQFYQEASDIFN